MTRASWLRLKLPYLDDEMLLSDKIALIALLVALSTFLQSVYFCRRSFRPIVTAMVRSHAKGNEAIVYDLVVQNSGNIPARNVRLYVHDSSKLSAAIDSATDKDRIIFLKCFEPGSVIPILQNGSDVTCSFGFTRVKDSFWKPRATFEIKVRYEGWLGRVYVEHQTLMISDSANFTGAAWGP